MNEFNKLTGAATSGAGDFQIPLSEPIYLKSSILSRPLDVQFVETFDDWKQTLGPTFLV